MVSLILQLSLILHSSYDNGTSACLIQGEYTGNVAPGCNACNVFFKFVSLSDFKPVSLIKEVGTGFGDSNTIVQSRVVHPH